MMFKVDLDPELIAHVSSLLGDGWTVIPQKEFTAEHNQFGFRVVRALIHESTTIAQQCRETVAIQALDQFMHSGVQIDHDQVNAFIHDQTEPTDETTRRYIQLINNVDAAKQTYKPDDPEDNPEFIELISNLNAVTERCPVIHHLSYPIDQPNFELELPVADPAVGNRILVSLDGGVIFQLIDEAADNKRYKARMAPGSCITTGISVPEHFDPTLPNHFGTSPIKLPPFLKMNMKDVSKIKVLVTEDDGNPNTRRHLCLIDLIQPSDEELAEMAAEEYEEEMADLVPEGEDALLVEEISSDEDIKVPDLEDDLGDRELGHM